MITFNDNHKLLGLLTELEASMKQQNLWSSDTPSAQALKSVQPFAVDTLRFEQWLQWVLIVKLRDMVRNNQELPAASGIAVMAERCFQNRHQDITLLCGKLDTLFSRVS